MRAGRAQQVGRGISCGSKPFELTPAILFHKTEDPLAPSGLFLAGIFKSAGLRISSQTVPHLLVAFRNAGLTAKCGAVNQRGPSADFEFVDVYGNRIRGQKHVQNIISGQYTPLQQEALRLALHHSISQGTETARQALDITVRGSAHETSTTSAVAKEVVTCILCKGESLGCHFELKPGGLVVVDPGPTLSALGVRRGNVVTAINKESTVKLSSTELVTDIINSIHEVPSLSLPLSLFALN